MSNLEPHARYIAAVADALAAADVAVSAHATTTDPDVPREGSITFTEGLGGGITRWALKWYWCDGWNALAEIDGKWSQFGTAITEADIRYEVQAYLMALDIVATPAEVVGAVQRITRHAHEHNEDVDARLAVYAR